MSAYGLVHAVDVPRIPLGGWFETAIEWLRDNLTIVFDAIGEIIGTSVTTLFGFLYAPSATQLVLMAAALVVAGLVRSGWVRPTALLVGAFLLLYVLELTAGAVASVISSMPSALFVWAMNLFGSEYVYPPLVLALLLLTGLVAMSLVAGRRLGAAARPLGFVAVLLLVLVGEYVLGVQFELFAVLLFAGLALFVSGWRLALFTVLGFMLIISMDRWQEAMSTLALVLIATLIAVVVAIPIGIWAAYNDRVSATVKPVLDFMQTMPAFVYLIPAIAFFGIGQVPGVIATVVFAMPPGVRLTELGIRQVDKELVEAGEAFGAPNMQILRGIQLPLALATIMAGINQVIMLSLSMVVIAGMVGAGGLGNTVYSGIARADSALGFEGGIGVVILAIFLDRLTGAVTRFSPAERARRMAVQ